MLGNLSHRHGFLAGSCGPVTAVAALRATREERQRAYHPLEAAHILRGLAREEGALFQLLRPGVDAGQWLLVPGWSWTCPDASASPVPESTRPIGTTAATLQTFTLTIADPAGRPLAGVPLCVTTPAGDQRETSTDGAGRIFLEGLTSGSCAVSSVIDGARITDAYAPAPSGGQAVASSRRGGPSALVEITRHRVRTGETPESIAAQHDVPWERIAQFNWGTSEPEALADHFQQTLGCTRRTPGGRLRFDDGDEPGILLIPRPWEARLAVGAAHELRVAPLRPLFLSLRTPTGLALPGAAYQIRFGDGSRREGRLGARGIARLDGVPDLPFTVSYPDELELLAASFAVSVRRALDEPAVAPLFTLLMQSREVIDRAAAVYHQHLDDLTGRGLAADIDARITDPEARRPLEALLSLAPLPGGPAATWVSRRTSP